MTAIALTIAGSDSGGGAGIQADLKTFAALGVYGACVITALTAQNTQGVTAIHDVPARFHRRADRRGVRRPRRRRGEDRHAVARRRRSRRWRAGSRATSAQHVVLDPVMVATSGDRLLAADALDALRRELIPRALIVTPNLPEAAALTGARAGAQRSARWKCRRARSSALGARLC